LTSCHRVEENPLVPDPPDQAVGICVSGGGLRAASFGLGVLQALQHRRGLLRGDTAADYLAAVSGGSYIAGAYTLVNCSDRLRPEGEPENARGEAPGAGAETSVAPFAPGSPEAEHLRRHCRYMIEDGGAQTSARLAGLMALNLLAVISIVAWAGVLVLGDPAFLAGIVLPSEIDSGSGWTWAQIPLAVFAAVVWVKVVLHMSDAHAEKRPRSRRRQIARVIGLPILGVLYAIGAAALLGLVDDMPVLRSPRWLLEHIGIVVAGIVGAGTLVALCLWLGQRLALGASAFQRIGRLGLRILTRALPVVAGVLIVVWSAHAIFRFPTSTLGFGLWFVGFFGALGMPLLLEGMIDRASPHHAYRDMLTRCFSVIRTGDDQAARPSDPRRVRLSELQPPATRGDDSFPELIICAAANMSDVGATPAGSNVMSLTITPFEAAVPAVPDAKADLAELEHLERPVGLGDETQPGMTLASAVAMTGAALSPAMGKMTRGDLRALFTVLNVRLGVWIPNLVNPAQRRRLADPSYEVTSTRPTIGGRPFDPEHPSVIVAIDDLIHELLGMHSVRFPNLYVTDGGHYDNLGLVELIRRRCRMIYCIDASGDRPGTARALADAILLAAGELGAQVSIDLTRFGPADTHTSGVPVIAHSHAIGTVVYADGSQGTLVVVKLGLTEASPPELHEYRRTDRRFPHHSTVNQVYRSDRFDAYRALGWSSGLEAMDDPATIPEAAPDASEPLGELAGTPG
jgi:hypothetical protein